MLRKFCLNALIAAFTFTGLAQVQAESPQDRYLFHIADALFDRAETRFPDLFESDGPTLILPDRNPHGGYLYYWFYRYYAASDTYLAVNEWEANGPWRWQPLIEPSVYVLGPAFGPSPVKAGVLADILQTLGSGITKPGSGECVDIPSPVPGMNAFYRQESPDFDGMDPMTDEDGSMLSWQPNEQGGVDIIRHTGNLLNLKHYSTSIDSVSSVDGLSYLNSVRTTFNPLTTFSADYEWNRESLSTEYLPPILLGPSKRYCVGQAWLSSGGKYIRSATYVPSTKAEEEPMPARSESVEWESGASVWQVVSINTSIEVPAGRFNTVEIINLPGGPGGNSKWIDIETGVTVREFHENSGNGFDSDWTNELIRLETPDQ